MPINQPSNQIRLTNVSLVRMKKGKKRYEIACYKNKVLEWRSGVETDLDNVLQIPAVFLSVSKGQTAPTQDLAKSFGAQTAVHDIILEILNRGELQVGEKERHAQLDRVHHEVIDLVAGKLVDPRTKRVYTPGMIEKALAELSAQGGAQSNHATGGGPSHEHDKASRKTGTADHDGADGGGSAGAKDPPGSHLPIWTGVVTTRSAKSQALDAMKALIAHQPIPVSRARMRLRITCPTQVLKQTTKSTTTKAAHDDADDDHHAPTASPARPATVKDRILSYIEQVETQEVLGPEEWEVVGFVEPGAFKPLSELLGVETRGRGRIEVLEMAVVQHGEGGE
ncbi:MAG: hypothetical protein M1826_005869 [Phylliscum demangeonii]|nr:MAG: hypothetical protein M1826_005869 [Phylliscum demangeonii]